MLGTSIFSFSHYVFNSIKDKIVIWATWKLSGNTFKLVESKILLFGKKLMGIPYVTNFPFPNTSFWDHPKFKEAQTTTEMWLLSLSQTTKFRQFQTERACRRQFLVWWKWQKTLQKGRKHWEKNKLLFTSNLSLSHSVFKRLVLQTRKNQGLFGRGLKDLKIQIAQKTLRKKVKLFILSNFTFFHNVFQVLFSSKS